MLNKPNKTPFKMHPANTKMQQVDMNEKTSSNLTKTPDVTLVSEYSVLYTLESQPFNRHLKHKQGQGH